MIAVSLNVGGGVRLIKPAKLACARKNTTNTTRTDARHWVCAAKVSYRWATRRKSLRELEYTHKELKHINPSLACIGMHYFCSLITFSIIFRNTLFLVKYIVIEAVINFQMNSCTRYLFGLFPFFFLFYFFFFVFCCKVKQQRRWIHSDGWTTRSCQ